MKYQYANKNKELPGNGISRSGPDDPGIAEPHVKRPA